MRQASESAVIEFRDVTKSFNAHRGLGELIPGLKPRSQTLALDRVSFVLESGRVLGLIGESGSGKSTLANVLVGLEKPTGGEVFFEGIDLETLRRSGRRTFHRRVQMVFQDPYASLNPRFTVHRTVEEPLVIHRYDRASRRERVVQALERAELRPGTAFLDKYPHELSGGQRQRVAIARAIVLEPRVLVADEPVSMLDVSVRAGILRLLRSFIDMGMALVFITHDLSLVGQVCDELMILYRGRVAEFGDASTVLRKPKHPYTKQLIAAVPVPDPTHQPAELPPVLFEGRQASTGSHACWFSPRCVFAVDRCLASNPQLRTVSEGQSAACHRIEELS